ncbi:hypothetical protein BOX15_Mlig028972g1, partial [Macrostomum lignano]
CPRALPKMFPHRSCTTRFCHFALELKMEAFKEAWVDIDSEQRGKIETSEFVRYLQTKGHDDVFIDKWRQVFDAEDAGEITMETYCDVLDIRPEELQSAKSLLNDVKYVSGDMPMDWQEKVVKVTKDVLATPNLKLSDLSKQVKIALDRAYGNLWHVMVAYGQFSCYFGFQPGFSYIFKIGKQVFIVFKTPQT